MDEAIGYAAGVMCSIWQGDFTRRQGIRLMSDEIHDADLDFFNDHRVASIVRAIATDLSKNGYDCGPDDKVRFTQRNLPWLFKAEEVMRHY